MSDHFDGKRFFNPGVSHAGFRAVFKWLLTRKKPPKPIKKKKGHSSVPATRVFGKELLVTFVNHSTVLLQWEGLNILTDPIWSDRCSPFRHFGPRRVHAPGIVFKDLPPIDLILLSHNHYDHLDMPTLKHLSATFKPLILTGLGIGKLLAKHRIRNVHEMDWWQEYPVSAGMKAAFVPAQHISGRWGYDMGKTLWGGFVLKAASGVVYFAGDTAYCPYFKEIRKKYGPPRLSLLPIGSYTPRWLMRSVHLEPKESVWAHKELESKNTLAIHHSTFQMADEGIEEPPKALQRELKLQNVSEDSFFLLLPGESKSIS